MEPKKRVQLKKTMKKVSVNAESEYCLTVGCRETTLTRDEAIDLYNLLDKETNEIHQNR